MLQAEGAEAHGDHKLGHSQLCLMPPRTGRSVPTPPLLGVGCAGPVSDPVAYLSLGWASGQTLGLASLPLATLGPLFIPLPFSTSVRSGRNKTAEA